MGIKRGDGEKCAWDMGVGVTGGAGCLFVAVAQVSFGQIPKGRHITQKVLLCSRIC